jgi:hypothetical protein
VSPEQFTAILGGITALLGAIGALVITISRYHQAVNHKMDALLELTASSSHAEGVKAERERRSPEPGHPEHPASAS